MNDLAKLKSCQLTICSTKNSFKVELVLL